MCVNLNKSKQRDNYCPSSLDGQLAYIYPLLEIKLCSMLLKTGRVHMSNIEKEGKTELILIKI
nr:hypothetical protein [Streptococcus hyointestinalis]